MTRQALARAAALALGGVFLYASFDKIAQPPEFARILYHYQVIGPSAHLPPMLPNLVAVVLPWLEAIVGLLLLAGVWRREAAAVAAALLAIFIAAAGSALARGIDIENCGCFSVGASGRRLGALLLVGDAALLAAALSLARSAAPQAPAGDGAALTRTTPAA